VTAKFFLHEIFLTKYFQHEYFPIYGIAFQLIVPGCSTTNLMYVRNAGTSPSLAERIHALKRAQLLTSDHKRKRLLLEKTKAQVLIDGILTVPSQIPVYMSRSEQYHDQW